jgi:hypothetical protein
MLGDSRRTIPRGCYAAVFLDNGAKRERRIEQLDCLGGGISISIDAYHNLVARWRNSLPFEAGQGLEQQITSIVRWD